MELKELREQKKLNNPKLTQTYMASQLGVSLTSYRLYECGAMGISKEKREKISEILGGVF